MRHLSFTFLTSILTTQFGKSLCSYKPLAASSHISQAGSEMHAGCISHQTASHAAGTVPETVISDKPTALTFKYMTMEAVIPSKQLYFYHYISFHKLILFITKNVYIVVIFLRRHNTFIIKYNNCGHIFRTIMWPSSGNSSNMYFCP